MLLLIARLRLLIFREWKNLHYFQLWNKPDQTISASKFKCIEREPTWICATPIQCQWQSVPHHTYTVKNYELQSGNSHKTWRIFQNLSISTPQGSENEKSVRLHDLPPSYPQNRADIGSPHCSVSIWIERNEDMVIALRLMKFNIKHVTNSNLHQLLPTNHI